MYDMTTKAVAGDMSHGHKHKYVQPRIMVIEMYEAGTILAGSDRSGWTTTDTEHGSGIIEEDPDHPYGDDDF